jgi:germination protein M
VANTRVGVRSLSVLSLLAVALTLAGCLHDDDTATVTVRETVTETAATGTVPDEAPAQVALYFLQDGKVWPEQRGIVSQPAIATATMRQLLEGSAQDFTTAIPPQLRLQRLEIANGVAAVQLAPEVTNRQALAQIVYTLTQFPTVRRVAINGARPVGRGAFEEQTPAILVESPLAGEEVEPGFEVTGTANTFEATFQYELRDRSNRVIADNFVTATSGSGTRGTFRFTVSYEIDEPQPGRLVVFEISAADGSRTNEAAVLLQLR